MRRHTQSLKHQRNRRGAEAVEFALILPILVLLVFGSIDYGLYFWQQARATNAILSAMRIGGMTPPPDAELGAGTCSTCVSAVEASAVANLAAIGITVAAADVRPTMSGVNGVCTMTINTIVDYESVTGLFQVPENYEVNIQVVAQAAKGC